MKVILRPFCRHSIDHMALQYKIAIKIIWIFFFVTIYACLLQLFHVIACTWFDFCLIHVFLVALLCTHVGFMT